MQALQADAESSANLLAERWTTLQTDATTHLEDLSGRTQALQAEQDALIAAAETGQVESVEAFNARWQDLQTRATALEGEQASPTTLDASAQGLATEATSTWDELNTRAQGMMARVSDPAGTAWGLVQQGWSDVQGTAASALASLNDAGVAAWNGLHEMATGAAGAVQNAATSACTAAQSAASGAVAAVAGSASQTWTSLQTTATAAWTALKDATGLDVDTLSTKIHSLVTRIQGVVGGILDSLLSAVSSLLHRVSGATSAALAFVEEHASAAWQSLKDVGSAA